jgi:hypothetical protein
MEKVDTYHTTQAGYPLSKMFATGNVLDFGIFAST